MNPIQRILNKFQLIVLDGAMATELERHGHDLNDSLWSAKILYEHPDSIKRVHRDYFEAGADCAITASYQATVEGYVQRGLSENEALKLIQSSVQIAVQARDEFWADVTATASQQTRPKPLVAASVGPYGAFLADGSEYRGDYKLSEEQLMEFHRPRMKALIEAGADILACETIPCMVEARAIARLLKEFPGTYAWISFSAKDEQHISNGESIAACAKWLNEHEQVAAVGINCTLPKLIPSLIHEIHSHTDKPVVVYPNLGEEYDPVTKTWQGHTCTETFGQSARQWYEAGARMIGGCCRTQPQDIREIVAWSREA
ncbi:MULTISPECIES: homocysteine S-methyltransferase [Paenibacillus]|uniref:homocysteine S-methyltransferase n=1 Tax=Paenibacillus TaxID=44249 RepID=UPI000C9FE515|nr:MULTISPECIES: homocysteine S-methyltransferase [Paenibacillus]KAF6586994.1 homocysteine S-methyltransferase [Paenibacillus sp. EKM211P]PNQ87312.1 homocysteine S-methyltransferase [Paenibacillus polymyxa]